jgi:hypothetical protein
MSRSKERPQRQPADVSPATDHKKKYHRIDLASLTASSRVKDSTIGVKKRRPDLTALGSLSAFKGTTSSTVIISNSINEDISVLVEPEEFSPIKRALHNTTVDVPRRKRPNKEFKKDMNRTFISGSI